MQCPANTIFNPVTARCVNINGPLGQLIQAVKQSTVDLRANCPPNTIRDPLSNICIPLTTYEGEIIEAVLEGRGCPPGYVLNPTTGRCVKITGTIGQQIVGRWSCLRYGDRSPDYQFIPLAHQIQVTDYFVNSIHPGILLYWALGSGKTCGAILMIDRYLASHDVQKVYVLSTGSLRENFLYQYCMICGTNIDQISQKFEFISYNYSLIGERLPSKADMDNSLIVIDEIHNLTHGYYNQSETYVAIYNLLKSLDNPKFIMLSGTPVTGSIDELYYILGLIKPTAFDSLDDYRSHFTDNQPDDVIRDRISDVVSRVSQTLSPESFPEVFYEYTTVPMSYEQEVEYHIARDQELLIFPEEEYRVTDPEYYRFQRTMFYLAISMLRSRQRCNMIYPEPIRKLIITGKAEPDRLIEDGGWITSEFIDDLLSYAPKFWLLLRLLEQIPGKHAVYSEFKTRYGIYMISALLKYHDITHLTFTGDMNDEQRAQTIKAFNSTDNYEGQNYRVMLLTEAGSEGQNFLQVRALHVMEQSINEFDIRQVMGRVVRYGSHIALPEDQRNIVIYRYFAVTYGENVEFDQTPNERKTSDFLAYERGLRRLNSIMPLIKLLDEMPITPPS